MIFFLFRNNVETNLSLQRYVVRDIFNGRSRSPHLRNLFAAARPFCAPSNANVGRRGRGYRISPLATHSFRDHDTSLLPSLPSSCLSRAVLDPPFDPAHDSPGEGATQPEYLRVWETSERSKKEEKERGKRKVRRMKQKEREREREKHIVTRSFFCFG